MKFLHKEDLISTLMTECLLNREQAEETVDAVFSGIREALKENQTVTLTRSDSQETEGKKIIIQASKVLFQPIIREE